MQLSLIDIPNHDIDLIAKLNVYPKAKQFPFIKYS